MKLPRLDVASTSAIGQAAERSRDRMVLLDYDGTLAPHVPVIEDAAPTVVVTDTLARLADHARVFVVSGRPARVLDDWLGDLPIGLVCEHGHSIRAPGHDWSAPEHPAGPALWEIALPLFEDAAARTPGSQLERKAASLAFHTRASDPALGRARRDELQRALETRLAGHPYTVLTGSEVIEVRHTLTTKGNATARLLEGARSVDFVLCAGNDRTDIDMFEAVARSGRPFHASCRVGPLEVGGDTGVDTPDELLAQLGQLAGIWARLTS